DSQQSWNTTSPKLSACIAETAFTWIPTICFCLCLPYTIVDTFRTRRPAIGWNAYNSARMATALTLSVVTVVDFILCMLRQFQFDDSPAVSYLISTAMYSITRLLLCLVLYCHQRSGVHCSGIVWFYLLLDTVFGALSVATYSLDDIRQSHEYVLFIIQYSLTVILFIMNSFPDRLPTYDNNGNEKHANHLKVCPKETASFPSRLSFWWITGLIMKGWRSPLTRDDLWAVRHEDSCKTVYGEFNRLWKKGALDAADEPLVSELTANGADIKSRSMNATKPESPAKKPTKLLTVITKGFWFYFITPSILKLMADCMQLVNPEIMKMLIGFTTDPNEQNWHGYMYALLLILTNTFQSLINGYQSQRMAVLGMRIRACLVSAVYRKSLVLSNHSKSGTTSGEIVNLMAVDSQRFSDMLPFISFVYTAPVQIGISLWLLYNELGIATMGGLVLMIVMVPVNGWVSAKVRAIQAKQMKLKDDRVRSLNEILSGIKVLKLYGWEEAFVANIMDIRRRELDRIRRSGMLNSVMIVLASCTPFFVSLVTFGLYIAIDENGKLDAQKAFVSISLFNLLRMPLTMVPNMITTLVLTLVSIKRLDKFLNFSELTGYVSRNKDQKEVIKVENASFTWERVEDVVDGGLKPTLDKINLKVMKGKFVAVVGSVGSGKSSLLSALLGDMEICSGSVNINGNSELAYVPQQAWIQNATLKDNILFGKEFDSKKYRKIIKACALKSDLLTLAGGDETEIGEKGINLSGGQKQRVSLARAVYSDADLYLFDDPLSAVDSHVGKHILDEVLS
ncbi:unnamed protein product, partial [Medioppia subpectinata]